MRRPAPRDAPPGGARGARFPPDHLAFKDNGRSRVEIADENISLHPLPEFDLLRECTLSQLRPPARIPARPRPHGGTDPKSRRPLAIGASRRGVAGLSAV